MGQHQGVRTEWSQLWRCQLSLCQLASASSVRFLALLVRVFLQTLEEVVVLQPDVEASAAEAGDGDITGLIPSGWVDPGRLLFCERFLEFLTDLLSQLPTRRFLRPLVEDLGVVVRCQLSRVVHHPRGRLFGQLLDLLRFYVDFQMDDQAGQQLGDEEVLHRHCLRVSALQLFLFKRRPELRTWRSRVSPLWTRRRTCGARRGGSRTTDSGPSWWTSWGCSRPGAI